MALFIILLNLVILESLLSVDNAAVLAIMVKDLPPNEKPRALKYGLIGAYVFRGLALIFAAWLVKIIWLKIVGGLYLLWLVYSHFTPENDSIEEAVNTNESKIFQFSKKIGLTTFWATVMLVEVMDLTFSIDNVFAAVALTNNLWLIMGGVFIGILAMRFVAGWFVRIIEKYPSLENSAFIVIALLGLKLILSGFVDYLDLTAIKSLLESHVFDLCFSGGMMAIFFFPLIFNNKESKQVI